MEPDGELALVAVALQCRRFLQLHITHERTMLGQDQCCGSGSTLGQLSGSGSTTQGKTINNVQHFIQGLVALLASDTAQAPTRFPITCSVNGVL